METSSQINSFRSPDPNWSTLYRIAAIGALGMVAFIPIQMLVFITWPPPSDVVGWFALFDFSKMVGLIDLDLFMIVDQVFVVFILLALYVSLRQANRSLMTVAVVLGLLGIASYFASTVAFEMLSLSGKYAAAATEQERAAIIAAGEAMLAVWQGTAYDAGYILEAISFLLIAVVMLRGNVFGKVTAWTGLVLGVLSLVPATVPVIGMWFALLSLIPLIVWDVLLAWKFLLMAKR